MGKVKTEENAMFGRKKIRKIESITEITISVSGMRFSSRYVIRPEGEGINLSKYAVRYRQHKEELEVEKQGLRTEEEVLKLLNDNNVAGWDGFSGAHPKHVSDGIMFTLEGIVNEGEKIYATGSQNFPKTYHDFMRGLEEMMDSR